MKYITLAAILNTPVAFAGGYSGWSVPTIVEYSNEGLLVYGNFNDVNNCDPGVNRPVFVAEDPNNPDFLKTVGPMLMMAVQAKSQVQFYLQECTTVSWRQGNNAVFNKAWTSGVIFNSPTNAVGVSPDNLIGRVETLEATTSQKTEIQVDANAPTSAGVWRKVDHDTLISLVEDCVQGYGSERPINVYLRENSSSNTIYIEVARCWTTSTETGSFIVPSGWEYQYPLNPPTTATSYTYAPASGN